jgi:hypothetical protein
MKTRSSVYIDSRGRASARTHFWQQNIFSFSFLAILAVAVAHERELRELDGARAREQRAKVAARQIEAVLCVRRVGGGWERVG